jgi:hypothetical protein
VHRTLAWILSSTIYALVIFAGTTAPAIAQNAGDIFNLVFGGIVQPAIVQATVAEWQKLPQIELACVDQTLRQRGSDLRTLIQQGTTPSDPRIAAMRSVCNQSTAQNNSSDTSVYDVGNTSPPNAYLSLRTQPTSAVGQRIMTMPNGTLLQVLHRQDDGWWYVKVISSGQEGWAIIRAFIAANDAQLKTKDKKE